jgi:hypothetical protein
MENIIPTLNEAGGRNGRHEGNGEMKNWKKKNEEESEV